MSKEYKAKAEVAMMGFVVAISSKGQLESIVDYCLNVLNCSTKTPFTQKAAEIVENAVSKYNSNNTPVSHFCINGTEFGMLMTFVRDDQMTKLDSTDGVLSWVENLNDPYCSELGYTFFKRTSINTYKRIG